MPPLARFHKLDASKRDRIIEAAAEEFAANGFDGASINKIIAAAGISKGAVYYYFEDKADLFATTVDLYTRRAGFDLEAVVRAEDADAFWRHLHDVLADAWTFTRQNPLWIGLGRAFAQIPREMWAIGRLGEYVAGFAMVIGQAVAHGQALGAVRDDLPVDALAQLALGASESFERYIFSCWDTLDARGRERLFSIHLENMHRLLLPLPRELFAGWHPMEEEP